MSSSPPLSNHGIGPEHAEHWCPGQDAAARSQCKQCCILLQAVYQCFASCSGGVDHAGSPHFAFAGMLCNCKHIVRMQIKKRFFKGIATMCLHSMGQLEGNAI
ncbi:hypothetical protein ABBQ32_007928 [Trebouxia sp. C0010 RCD-2024]